MIASFVYLETVGSIDFCDQREEGPFCHETMLNSMLARTILHMTVTIRGVAFPLSLGWESHSGTFFRTFYKWVKCRLKLPPVQFLQYFRSLEVARISFGPHL